VTVVLHAGPVSPASTDSVNSKATVIWSGSDISSSDEEESIPSFAATPSRTFAKAFSAASPALSDDSVFDVTPGSTDAANSEATDIHTGSDTSSGNEEESLASFEATPCDTSVEANNPVSPTSVDSLFKLTPGSPPSLGLGSPFAAGSPLNLSALGDFSDLLLDDDAFEAISPLPALTAASAAPQLGTMTLAIFQSPPRSVAASAWTFGQLPTRASSNASTPPRGNNEPYTNMIFSPLPLVGTLAAQRLPAEDLRVMADLGSAPRLALTQPDLIATDGASYIHPASCALADCQIFGYSPDLWLSVKFTMVSCRERSLRLPIFAVACEARLGRRCRSIASLHVDRRHAAQATVFLLPCSFRRPCMRHHQHQR